MTLVSIHDVSARAIQGAADGCLAGVAASVAAGEALEAHQRAAVVLVVPHRGRGASIGNTSIAIAR
jgi:hypothetical protein